jgi:hypothetical protein
MGLRTWIVGVALGVGLFTMGSQALAQPATTSAGAPAPAVTEAASAAPPAVPPAAAAPPADSPPGTIEALPPDVRARLTDAQLFQLVKDQQDSEPPAVAIVVPVACFLVTFAVVAAALYAAYRKERLRHETLRAAIERGASIPADLITPPPRPRSDLRRGVLLTASGIGLGILLAATAPDKSVWTASLIPTLLGLGYLLVHRLEGSEGTRSTRGTPGAPAAES